MTWWAIDVTIAPRSLISPIAEWLALQTGRAVEEREDAVLAAMPSAEAARSLVAGLREVFPAATLKIREFPVEDRDWATSWRDGLGVRRVGRVVIVPTWVDHRPGPGETAVLIDPETAFGTGEHGSTRAALALLQNHLAAGGSVVDFGSGSGILTIAAVRLGASRATGIEIDADAVAVAERNAERNGVASACAFVQGDAARLGPLLGPADVVLSNILRLVNAALLPEVRETLSRDGVAIFSGMEETEAPLFLPALAEADFEILDQVCDAGWWAVASRPC